MNITELRTRLTSFLSDSKAVNALMTPLKKGSSIQIIVPHIVDTTLEKQKKNRYSIRENHPDTPDISVEISLAIITDLLKTAPEDAGKLLEFLAHAYFQSHHEENMQVRVHTGLIKLTARGYFKLLSVGGPALLEILRGEGLGSLSTIKQTIRSITHR